MFMDLNEALREIKRLEQQNRTLQKEKAALIKASEISQRLLFDLNEKLNRLMSERENALEKQTIERVRQFIPKTEVMKPVLINETETLVKAKKKRKVKAKDFETYDFERHVSETRYERPEIGSCPICGNDMTIASEKVRYVVESIPATLKVTKIIKQSCKCPRCNPQNHELYYPVSGSLFPGSIMTHSFVSYICDHKYELGIPFEHLSRHIHETLGIDISKQNLANYMAKLALIVDPIYQKMRDDLLHNAAKVIHADETTLSVSRRPAEDKERKKSYVYVYASSYYDSQIAIYDFHESRSIDRTAAWLKDYQGVIVCDDYAGYTKLRKEHPGIRLQRCFAHVRRRFADIVKVLPEENLASSYAVKILTVIGKLFKLEAEYKEKKYLPSKILERRKVDHPTILAELEALLFQQEYKPGSAIEEAVMYARNVWPELTTYLSSGYVELTNNLAERAVKPFVINRKVFMTSGSYDGARYTTVLFSLVRTARINDLNVSKYFEYVLDHIQTSKVEDLLPYSPDVIRRLKNT